MALGRSAAVLAVFAVGASVLAGVALLIAAPAPASRCGWFAYAPLPDARPAASVIIPNWQQCLGAALVVVGLLAAAVVVGYRAGRASGAGGRPVPELSQSGDS